MQTSQPQRKRSRASLVNIRVSTGTSRVLTETVSDVLATRLSVRATARGTRIQVARGTSVDLDAETSLRLLHDLATRHGKVLA